MGMGLKEVLLIAAIVGGLVWVSMIRSRMEERTSTFMRKLKAPDDGEGFGWRGMLIAFVIGIVCCCLFALMALRIWIFYHPRAIL